MQTLLYEYNLDLTTWFYLSSLLAITVFFKFSPLIRLRNLDLVGVVALVPALVLVLHDSTRNAAYLWLFVLQLLLLLRLMLDPLLVRRPLLEPNLNSGGMTFLGAALLVFLTAHIATRGPQPAPDLAADGVDKSSQANDAAVSRPPPLGFLPLMGNPVFAWLYEKRWTEPEFATREGGLSVATVPPAEVGIRVMLILSLIATVVGLLVIGARHYANINTGLAVSTLFLLLPTTAISLDRADQLLPAAFLVWAVACYRRPVLSGSLLGIATGLAYFPLFLLPMWVAFYWARGLNRFLLSSLVSLGLILLMTLLAFGWQPLADSFVQALGWMAWENAETQSVWGYWFEPAYRLPVQVGFVMLCLSFIVWPVHKNLGTLMSCSTVVMLASQFLLVHGGGVFVNWYVPLLLLTVFRPNLQDQAAMMVLATRSGGGGKVQPPHPQAA